MTHATQHRAMQAARRLAASLVLAGLAVTLFGAAPAAATTSTFTSVKATWADTNLPPGGEGEFNLFVHNVGDASYSRPLTLVDQLPPGVKATKVTSPRERVTALFNVPWSPEPYPVPEWEVHLSEFCTGNGPGAAPKIVGATVVTCALPMQQPTVYYGFNGTVPILSSWLGKPVDLRNYFNAEEIVPSQGFLPPIDIEVEAPASPPANPGENKAIVYGGGTTLPDGSPCAQEEADLATLPPCAEDTNQVPFSSTPASFGIEPGTYEADVFGAALPRGPRSRTAGDHPFEQRVNFALNQRFGTRTITNFGAHVAEPTAMARTVEVTLPRGLIGNPQALPRCPQTTFAEGGATSIAGDLGSGTACPSNTQVGFINIELASGTGSGEGYFQEGLSHVPVYNLVPPRGTPVDLGFKAGVFVIVHIYSALDPAQNYAVRAVVPDISQAIPAIRSELTLWGVPGDPAHDKFRYYPAYHHTGEFNANGEEILALGGAPFEGVIRPFFTNPMDCGFDNGGSRIRVASYAEPGVFTPVQEESHPDNVTGCEDQRFRFEPEVALQPTDRHAGAPTGLDVHLKVPLRNDEVTSASELYAENGHVKGISTPPIKKAVVTFPEGMTLSPSAAQGLTGCTAAEIGLGTDKPVTCPDNSQYGKLTLHTPLLPVDEQPEGFIYIAKQNENPFHNFLSMYFVIEQPERGILVKIPGKLDLNEKTGQITTSFDDLPQFPVSDMQLTFKGGVRAGLVEPSTCGAKTIKAEFFTWQDPTTPHVVNSSYEINQKPDGSPCVNNLAERPFEPSFQAETLNPQAGAYSPFNLHLTRSDEDQEFSQLRVTLPPGLAAKFAGVGICPDSGVAQALARETVAGDGALEQSDPSCPASSEIGTTMVGAGVGVPLSWVPGKVYLAGPYKGAPMSIVVISPAIVGPYDLGVITVRTALYVNPETAQGEALSDPFPQIFQGIPVRIRDIRLNLNREGFTLNPTSCEAKQIEAKLTGTGNTTASLQNRFQAGECANLGFAPKLSFRLYGGTHRGDHPKLKAVVRMPQGGANIAKAIVALPRSEFLDQGHIRTVCTRVQFAAHECPTASIYGYAVAKTPLFDHPLEGPVYLRSSSHQLPDLVAALKGPASQPVEVDLDGRIDSVNGGIRNSFEVVPDAPVESFKLIMQGGRKGLLVNSQNLCAKTNRATADFTAQNGKVSELEPVVNAGCGKAHKKGKHGHKRHRLGRHR